MNDDTKPLVEFRHTSTRGKIELTLWPTFTTLVAILVLAAMVASGRLDAAALMEFAKYFWHG